jgi:hypothetical protein
VIILELLRSTVRIVAEKFPLGVATEARVKPVPGGPDKGGIVGLGVGLGVEVGAGVGVAVGIGVGVGVGSGVGVGATTVRASGRGESEALPMRFTLLRGAAKLIPKTAKTTAVEKPTTSNIFTGTIPLMSLFIT